MQFVSTGSAMEIRNVGEEEGGTEIDVIFNFKQSYQSSLHLSSIEQGFERGKKITSVTVRENNVPGRKKNHGKEHSKAASVTGAG